MVRLSSTLILLIIVPPAVSVCWPATRWPLPTLVLFPPEAPQPVFHILLRLLAA